MRATLIDPEHERILDRYGFVVIPFLDDEQLAALSAAYQEVGTAPDDPQLALYFGFHSSSLEYKQAMGAAIRPIVQQRASEVFDDHDIYLAIFITKWPGPQSGFGPHQDPTLVDERSYRGVTIWTPLGPTGIIEGRDNGMLHVVPGSHKFADGARVRDIDKSVFAPHEAAIIAEHGVGVPTRPGEAIVFDNRLIHYSMPNETDSPRIVVSLGVRPSEATCVLPREDGEGRIDLYAVSDESWIEVTASTVAAWVPPGEPIAKVDPPSVSFTPEELRELCAAVGPAPHTVPGNRPPVPDPSILVPDPFCAFCGTTEGFSEEDRQGRGKAQLVCASCRVTLGHGAGPLPSIANRLAEDGYAVVDLPPGLVDEVRGVWEELDPERPAPYFSSNVHLSREGAREVDQRLKSVVGPVVTPLLGEVEPFLAAFITKGAHVGDRVELHQDWSYTDERVHRTVLLWIPLEDVDAANGALSVVPGSHHWTDKPRADGVESPTRFVQDELAERAVLVPLRAGQAVAYDPAVIHGSGPNAGDRERVAAAVAFAPRGAQLVHHHVGPDGVAEAFEVDERYYTCEEFRSRPPGTPRSRTTDVVGPDDFAHLVAPPPVEVPRRIRWLHAPRRALRRVRAPRA